MLEFDKLLEVVAAGARSPGGRRLVLELVPLADPDSVQSRQALVAELRDAIDGGVHAWPLDGIHDLRVWLAVAARAGSRLEPLELLRVLETLQAAARCRRFLDTHSERFPRLREHAAALGEHAALAASIETRVLETGEIADDASPELGRLRRQLASQRAVVLRRLEAHLKRLSDVSEGYVTLRGERFVIPVRADAGPAGGIVHDRSGSGATLFVEPLDVVDANNELQALRDAESREVQRILEELTRMLGDEAEPVRRSLEALEAIDALHASALASVEMRAVRPSLGGRLHLRGARHPLLERQLGDSSRALVPLDVDLGAGGALVVTGPNTGGKTVALKTIGLLVLMHQSGLQLPLHPDSELPLFERLVVDIGDEQSIEASESTFSSHLRHVRAALGAASRGLLALFDEFMAGTDPEDGAALAKAVLRRLVATGATTLVTTHLGALKLFAAVEPGLCNASMLFDSESRLPLFRLQTGVPGSSNALATAGRLGFDPDLLEEARRERGEDVGRIEAVLQALEAERQRLAAARADAESAAAEAARERDTAAAERAELTRQSSALRARSRREVEELVERARARIERTVRELRETRAEAEAIRAAHRTLEEVREESSRGPAQPEEAPGEPPQPGDTVWIRSLQREGRLESLQRGGRARVRFGRAEVVVRLGDLERRAGSGVEPEEHAAPGFGYDVHAEEGTSELDVRGFDREAALAALDRFLDRAALGGAPWLRIVHGKGTGALRKCIQEHLAQHASVAAFRLGEQREGGAGVTIVKLH